MLPWPTSGASRRPVPVVAGSEVVPEIAPTGDVAPSDGVPIAITRAAGCWIDARSAQDLVDGERRDHHAELRQLALDPAVPPRRIRPCQPDNPDEQCLGPVGGRPGLRRLLVSYLPPASLRCQARSVAGSREGRQSSACAANCIWSPGSYRTRLAFRRSTAFSYWSTSNSASFPSVTTEHQDDHGENPGTSAGR